MNFSILRWEVAVLLLAMGILLADLFRPRLRKETLGWISVLSLGGFLIYSLLGGSGLPADAPRLETAHGLYILDRLAIWGKQFSLLATLLTILMSIRYAKGRDEHLPEYMVLQLFACLGMMLVVSTTDFLSLFVALELMTVSFYVLVSFRRKELLCLEAGLKYLIYGALSSGILLYGVALIYAGTGEIQFSKVADYTNLHPAMDNDLLFLGLILLLAGIGFKISAVPFHWWTPDVYEGAPTPTVALLSVGSKGAGFVLLIRILFEAFPTQHGWWIPLIGLASGASILLGNLSALSQTNLKRLMGYSSISHTGYMLLGIMAASLIGLSGILYYLLGYLLANILIFAVMCETSEENPRQDIRGYSGLGERSSWAAAALVVGLLSLSGIPPLAGFFGKLLLFQAAMAQQHFILLAISILGVICSFYYYLGVIRTMYFSAETSPQKPLILFNSTRWALAFLTTALFVVGFYQSPWWNASKAAILTLLH